MKYQPLLDSGHMVTGGPICDTFDKAYAFGKDWRDEMIASDDEPEEAAEVYDFEVKEIKG